MSRLPNAMSLITRSRIPFTIVVLLALIGCVDSDPSRQLAEVDTSQVTLGEPLDSLLRAPHNVELLSLVPDPPEHESPDDFHGWRVFGRASVKPATALTRDEQTERWQRNMVDEAPPDWRVASREAASFYASRNLVAGEDGDLFFVAFASGTNRVYIHYLRNF